MEKREELYAGKAKSVYTTDDANLLVLVFRNDTSAFDGQKIDQLDRKGMVNNKFNAFIMTKLEEAGIPTHFDKLLSDTECLVKNLDMIEVECVVRNIAAGSLCKRLGVEEGLDLNPPTFELFLKNDALHDPMINEYHCKSFGWATEEQLQEVLSARNQWYDQQLSLQESLPELYGQLKNSFSFDESGVYRFRIVVADEDGSSAAISEAVIDLQDKIPSVRPDTFSGWRYWRKTNF